MEFRVGVIGATGFIGSAYREEIRESSQDAKIVALCARNRGRLEAAAAEDSCDFITDDWRQVVEHPDVNFVIVATPDALHHEAVMASAKNGKHMFCDKPIGMNVGEAYEMRQAYREAGLSHFVPFWARCEPLFLRGKAIVDAGTLGDIRAIIYRWQNPRPAAMPFTWRDDATLSAAGSIADVGSHAYDAVRWLTGTEAKRVLAHAETITPPNRTSALSTSTTPSNGAEPTRRQTAKNSARARRPTMRRSPGSSIAALSAQSCSLTLRFCGRVSRRRWSSTARMRRWRLTASTAEFRCCAPERMCLKLKRFIPRLRAIGSRTLSSRPLNATWRARRLITRVWMTGGGCRYSRIRRCWRRVEERGSSWRIRMQRRTSAKTARNRVVGWVERDSVNNRQS